jgi:hypothetical protein
VPRGEILADMMSVKTALLFAFSAAFAIAETPLPELRVEPAAQSSILFVKNAASQPPLTAFLVELIGYPGSYYQLWEDDVTSGPVEPGVEKRIPISDMTVGAVPNYVKVTAAIYADGTSAGAPEKVTQLVERRKAMLVATRELIATLDKARIANTEAATVAAELKQQADALPKLTRSTQKSQAAINQSAVKNATSQAAVYLGGHSIDETLTALRGAEAKLAASKPAL